MAWNWWYKAGLVGIALLLIVSIVQAAIGTRNMVSDVRGTKHNLSAASNSSTTPSGGTVPVRNIKATSETEVCVFCHTPHGANTAAIGPLWNRKLSTATYTPYTSSSIDAYTPASATQPSDNSKLCLSCHDGTMAINQVNVLRGSLNQTVSMTATTMPFRTGTDALNGFTPNLGINLTNDHPISFTYNSTVATSDGELRTPGTGGAVVGNRVAGTTPKVTLPLFNNQIECATCHDPHIRDKNEASNGNAKFLRLNRFQVAAKAASGTSFDAANDIMCLACHDKGGDSWNFSAHAVATQAYANTSATTTYREFPSGIKVYQAACLNCHDTHTVQGSRRLLREATSSTVATSSFQLGIAVGDMNKSAIEQACYACHDGSTNILASVTTVPNIKSDFASTYRMPVVTTDQGTAGTVSGTSTGTPGTTEVHDITSIFNDTFINCTATSPNNKCGADLLEPRAKLGYQNPGNRHAECTDCHNPHRVIKNQNGLPGQLTPGNTDPSLNKAGTHVHVDGTEKHTNLISGVLRGSWGVEPVYSSPVFNPASNTSTLPTFTVKRGDPGSNLTNTVGQPYVTREYQICLKCHSNYAYDDDNKYPVSGPNRRPLMGGSNRTAANLRTNYSTYTNQAVEFQAPSTHKKDVNATGVTAGGWAAGFATNNHRSWHPVMDNTGRDATERGGLSANNWRAPWNNDLGNQTMYCSDCHGTDTTRASGSESVMPLSNTSTNEDGKPWGPHGSSNPFILKGLWNTDTGMGQQTTGLCFKCHSYSVYTGGGTTRTGFYINSGASSGNDGHKLHRDKINARGTNNTFYCNYCHVAVPHGWKNKALLVNLDDLGWEVGVAPGTKAAAFTSGSAYNNGPYYRNAILRVVNFRKSGEWTVSDCMGGSKDTMINVCKNPP